MMRLFFVVILLGIVGNFNESAMGMIQAKETVLINNKQINTDELSQQTEANQGLIMGFWRGYYETPEFTIYYGYEFRGNGTYAARHRIYKQEETILDEYWQGQWTFDGKTLSIQGTVTNGENQVLKYRFQLKEDGLLYYEGGDLKEPDIPQKMGRYA